MKYMDGTLLTIDYIGGLGMIVMDYIIFKSMIQARNKAEEIHNLYLEMVQNVEEQ